MGRFRVASVGEEKKKQAGGRVGKAREAPGREERRSQASTGGQLLLKKGHLGYQMWRIHRGLRHATCEGGLAASGRFHGLVHLVLSKKQLATPCQQAVEAIETAAAAGVCRRRRAMCQCQQCLFAVVSSCRRGVVLRCHLPCAICHLPLRCRSCCNLLLSSFAPSQSIHALIILEHAAHPFCSLFAALTATPTLPLPLAPPPPPPLAPAATSTLLFPSRLDSLAVP